VPRVQTSDGSARGSGGGRRGASDERVEVWRRGRRLQGHDKCADAVLQERGDTRHGELPSRQGRGLEIRCLNLPPLGFRRGKNAFAEDLSC
jgi:hypothetical protein